MRCDRATRTSVLQNPRSRERTFVAVRKSLRTDVPSRRGSCERIASGLRRDEPRAAGAGTDSPPLAPEGRAIPETRTRRAKTAPDASPKTTRRAKATTAPKTEAPKTDANGLTAESRKSGAKLSRAAKSPELRAAESDARRAALAAKKDPADVRLARAAKRAKANVSKLRDGASAPEPTPEPTPTPTTTTRGKTGPTPARIALAKDVAARRGRGEKWVEIAAATGVAEPTLAKLRKDVRAGVFANVSPAKDRTPASGAGSF